MSRWILASLFLLIASPVGAITPGLYYDPNHDGHGFDLQPVGQQWVVVFYTYDSNGQPEWMLAVAQAEGERVSGTFDRFDYDAGRTPAQQSVGAAGSFVVDFETPCADGDGIFEWTIDEESGSWCVRSLLDRQSPPEADYTGLWYAGEDDAGWGLTLGFQDGSGTGAEVQVLFYYDAQGRGRWALGVADEPGPDSETTLFNFTGYCRTCDPIPLAATEAGTIGHQLGVDRGLAQGTAQIDVAYVPDPGGRWLRAETPLIQLSEPSRGLIPMPEQIEPEESVAFVNVTLVPMDSERIVPHQTVVVEAGVITRIGEHGQVSIPPEAIRIDARDLFLGPGLQDMHTHITGGGQLPMEESGLLFIANGVTTILNMGDGGTMDLPGMDDRFGSGELIGPKLYAGLVAYGPGDNRAASLTVTSPSSATGYAERALREGYEYLKVYNTLSPEVVQQFMTEGQRLGLPVIGHLPKTITMERALDTGQQMIAHVAEVYFTFFANQPDESLLDPALEQLLAFDVYLTDTLTASESFAELFGGNEENFALFRVREGAQYTSPFVRNGWRSFFESATLQPPGSQPGQLDFRLVFFKQMVKHFADGGVKLILGTDSPGHTGVISGFSVHEHFRIYHEIGLTPFQAYQAASATPGRFFDDTIAPEIPFGTVEEGKRADLILLENDPLSDVVHLNRPLAVMSQGRYWSRSFLQARLDELDDRYPDPFKALVPTGEVPLHWCADHSH